MKQQIIHFLNHIKSGKKLDTGDELVCSWCQGFGYPKSINQDFINRDITIIAKFYVDFDEKMNVCDHCKGLGKEPKEND